MKLYCSNIGDKINETYKPSRSDAYVLLSSKSLMIGNSETKTVDITLFIHGNKK